MKSITIFALLLTNCCFMFAQTESQTKKIVDEILLVTAQYNSTWETIDMDKVSRFHSDNSFRYYRNMELSVSNNEEFKKLYPQYLSGTKSWTIEMINPVVQVLSEDVAVIGFTGKAVLVTKDDKVSDLGSGAYTYIWKKIGREWKIVHIHESTK